MTSHRPVWLILVIVFGLSSCGGRSGGEGDAGLSVVATTTIIGDLVRQVAGGNASVEVLMPVGADPHDFQASAAQIATVNQADLVVVNGLGLEEGLQDALHAAESDGVLVLEVGPLLKPLPLGQADEGDGHGADDPHVWFDPIRMASAARLVAEVFETVDPDGGWAARADAYASDLTTADQRISELFSGVPAERRKLVTSHDSLGYLADRYDFEVVGVVIPGGSTLSDPSSEELAQLIDTIRSEGVRVIFAETTQSSSIVEAVGYELGEDITIVDLYTDSLGEPGSGADTLVAMLTTNAERIAGALGG